MTNDHAPTEIEQAKAALDMMRTFSPRSAIPAVRDCPHPAEALEHSPIVLAWACTMCWCVVDDESLAHWIAGVRPTSIVTP